VIVLDASAAVSALLRGGPARAALAAEVVHVPHLVDIEVLSALRRCASSGQVADSAAADALDTWRRLGVTRYPVVGLLNRIWELRANVTAYDAAYVALAETLGCAVVTADARLARAPGLRCPVTVVPR
jgi:predicted nucleic acid-binding protein